MIQLTIRIPAGEHERFREDAVAHLPGTTTTFEGCDGVPIVAARVIEDGLYLEVTLEPDESLLPPELLTFT